MAKTKQRTPKNKTGAARRISPEAAHAWRHCDYHGLHKALGLPPWHASPLPECVDVYGVTEGYPRKQAGYDEAILLQRMLYLELGGHDRAALEAVYKQNLAEDQETLAYAEKTGGDVAKWRERVAYREKLLNDLT